jgi:hypothetical protein
MMASGLNGRVPLLIFMPGRPSPETTTSATVMMAIPAPTLALPEKVMLRRLQRGGINLCNMSARSVLVAMSGISLHFGGAEADGNRAWESGRSFFVLAKALRHGSTL